jgi:hypothetical protein
LRQSNHVEAMFAPQQRRKNRSRNILARATG